MTSFTRVQRALGYAAAHLGQEVSLAVLAARAGLSPFHLHRLFAAVAGETPKQYVRRLRLSRAAALLLGTEDSVLHVALACGFESHEGFTRAFHQRFGLSPTAYRARGFATGAVDATGASAGAIAAAHAAAVRRAGPCVGLFHMSATGTPRATRTTRRSDMSYTIIQQTLAPQPVLIVRRRVKRSDIAATIADVLPHIFHYAQQHGIALTGHPFTRYVDVGTGLLTIEPGMRIASGAAAGQHLPADPAGVIEDTLPGGPAATTIHAGPYDTLADAYAAVETWIETNGLTATGAPWESYVTDPADYPDPKDWKTEISWPMR